MSPNLKSIGISKFLYISPVVILLCAVCSIYFYRSKFGGELSARSDDWSAFGSYVGGVFGPLISFVTLLAVLVTVNLQRKLLGSQLAEFDRINTLQKETFISQKNQIEKSAEDALKLQISAAQDSAVKLIQMRIEIHEHDFDRHHDLIFKFDSEHAGDLGEFAVGKMEELLLYRDRARLTIDLLSIAALDIATKEFCTVLQVREELRERIVKVYEDLDVTYPLISPPTD